MVKKRKSKDKQSFVLYHTSRNLFAKLPAEECKELILAIFDYSMGQDVTLSSSGSDIAFAAIQPYMDENARKYEERCRINSQNGAKGGAPRGNKNAEKKPTPNPPAVAFTEEDRRLCLNIGRLFNEICSISLPRIRFVSDARKMKILETVRAIEKTKQDPLVVLENVFQRVISSGFLNPSSVHPAWRASFDWLFKDPNTWAKVLEGQYDELFDKKGY